MAKTQTKLKLFLATVKWAGRGYQLIIETLPGDEVNDVTNLARTIFQVSFGSLHALKIEDVKPIRKLPIDVQPIGKQVSRLKNCDWAWIK